MGVHPTGEELTISPLSNPSMGSGFLALRAHKQSMHFVTEACSVQDSRLLAPTPKSFFLYLFIRVTAAIHVYLAQLTLFPLDHHSIQTLAMMWPTVCEEGAQN